MAELSSKSNPESTFDSRWKHFLAMALIGDGVMAMVCPERDARAWRSGPKVWRSLMADLSKRPGLTRAIGALQVAGGVWWAIQNERCSKRSSLPAGTRDVSSRAPAR